MLGSQLYLLFFPLFLHLTHSSLGGCWERGLSNIWHWGSEVANRRWCKNTHTWTHGWKKPPTCQTCQLFFFFFFKHEQQIKSHEWRNKNEKNQIKSQQFVLMINNLLTGLCFTAGFLSAGFLAASDTFLTVKGTPYLLAGLVIFWAGASGMEPGADLLAGYTNAKKKNI